jgi:hypothetical protein
VKGDLTFNERGAAPADTQKSPTHNVTCVQHKTDTVMAHRENERHSQRSVKHKHLRLLHAADLGLEIKIISTKCHLG